MNQGEGFWRAYPENLFLDGWPRWDAAWYATIVDTGYTNLPRVDQQRDTAFFPVYPILVRLAKLVVDDTFVAGIIVSNVAFLLASIVFFRLVRSQYDAELAGRSLLLLSIYPFSFFFSAVYSESVFLLAVLCAFYFGERRRWGLAALSAAVAGATRIVGVVTVLGLLILYLEQVDFDWRKLRPNILWLLLGFSGLASHVIYLARRFGEPLAFVVSQREWGYYGWDVSLLQETIRMTWSRQAILAGRFPAMDIIHLAFLVVTVVLALAAWRRPRIAYAVWATLTLLLSSSIWPSMGRFTSVVFPIYIVAALLLKKGPWFQVALFLSTLFLALFTIMYTHWYWVA
ncbi:MAG TPA: mannosyltransferase family protein [Ardenticatenaceae bacterium]|nr:mannosyltransferase family protein [Ardenticatenaceae bacterium]